MTTRAKKPAACNKPECGAPLIFARTASGALLPVDQQRDASQTSRHALTHAADGKYYVRVLTAGESPGRAEYLHHPHYLTCLARKTATVQPTLLEDLE